MTRNELELREKQLTLLVGALEEMREGDEASGPSSDRRPETERVSLYPFLKVPPMWTSGPPLLAQLDSRAKLSLLIRLPR